MNKKGLCFILLAIASVAARKAAPAQQTPRIPNGANWQRNGDEAKWQEDLKFFADHFSSGQKDFDKLYPKDHFNEELSAIRNDAAQIPNSETALRLMRLVAGGHIAHTEVGQPLGFHRLPLRFYWFSDGLAVISATQEYSQAIGTHVVSIGSMTPQQAEAAAAPYIAYENETGLHQRSPQFMRLAELLHHLKLDNPDGSVNLTLAKPGAEPFTLAVRPSFGKITLVTAFDALSIPTPLYRKNPDSFYWYEYLPESQTLYIQYNQCENDPKLSFADFTRQMFAAVDSQSVQRTVLDIQSNGGGDSRVIHPLESALKARPKLSGHGRLYVLMGPATFSSGLYAAVDFRDDLHAILVGEPLGENLDTYGEVKSFKLPNSGLEIFFSTKFFRFTKGTGSAPLAPDVLVTRSLEDYLAGRDPVLDAAIHHPLQ
jgi:hypothetical protein